MSVGWLLGILGLASLLGAVAEKAEEPQATAVAEAGSGSSLLPSRDCRGYDEEWGLCTDLPPCETCQPIDCKFGQWEDWYGGEGCTGLVWRQRAIKKSNNECGKPCHGPKITSQQRIPKDCVIELQDCKFSEWKDWNECKQATDQRYREREVVQEPINGGKPCGGETKQTTPCGTAAPPVDCNFETWSPWLDCSETCGYGRNRRTRGIANPSAHGGKPCSGPLLESQKCKVKDCPKQDCELGDWTGWSTCDSGETQSYRMRKMLKAPTGDGKRCTDPLKQTRGCPLPVPADCTISEWGEWSACDKECDGGQQFRRRVLRDPPMNGGACPTQVLQETKSCNTMQCDESKTDCQLGDWESWTPCTAKCGKGTKERARKITSPSSGGKGCSGALSEILPCVEKECSKVDCKWSEWYDWSACTCTCGGGTRHRTRVVAVAPKGGGAACEAKSKSEAGVCNTQTCETKCTDAEWADWGAWSTCSATCKSGYRSRSREVARDPSSCGKPVSGIGEQYVTCDWLPACVSDHDCQLSNWAEWSSCSCTCFGIRERNRFISVFAAGNGKPCSNDTLQEITPCNPGPGEEVSSECGKKDEVDCVLSDWSAWTKCTRTCGSGQSSRSRVVLQEPQAGGKPCSGVLTVLKSCNSDPCEMPVCLDCIWGEWSDWGACTKCGGQRWRHRSIQQLPNDCPTAKMCPMESAKEVSNCTSHCQEHAYCRWSDWSDSNGCDSGCGPGVESISRSLGYTKDKQVGPSLLFKGPLQAVCAGTQTTLKKCHRKSCTPECVPKDCEFSDWSDWAAPTCQGLCERTRTMDQNNECGVPCSGTLLETKTCPVECNQAVDCQLSSWTPWTRCLTPNGQKIRHRTIEREPENGGEGCHGKLRETKACVTTEEPDCKLSTWSDWSVCPHSCGGSIHERSRTIVQYAAGAGELCEGTLKEMGPCNTKPCPVESVDCKYEEWEDWSSCGKENQRYRQRHFATSAKGNGVPCRGNLEETETCLDEVADCVMSAWSKWNACDKTCNGGQQQRHRQIHTYPKNGGKVCEEAMAETRGCNKSPCEPTDCKVSEWADWSDCSSSCGPGQVRRSREIVQNREPGGNGCDEPLEETKACPAVHKCNHMVDCTWQDWSEWSGCTCSCEGGQRTRSRRIRDAPQNGGQPCEPKEKEQVEPCNTQPCAKEDCVDGEWDEWQDWSECSATCGGGVARRNRKIGKMANYCGKAVAGKDRDVKFCNVEVDCEKPRDCIFGEWGSWTGCTASCNGIMRRSRRIKVYGRGEGSYCIGPMAQTSPCHPGPGEKPPQECAEAEAIDCELSDWTTWSPCSASCGGGEQDRKRDIIKLPQGDGEVCKGPLKEIQECARQNCEGPNPIDCEIGDWEEWGACDKCAGQRRRIRNILQHPKNGGKNCDDGAWEEIGKCPRRCHEKLFCTWNGWLEWSKCSANCGIAKRVRKRYLGLSHKPAELPKSKQELMEKFATIQIAASDTSHHVEDLALAFACGALSLGVLVGVVRVVSRIRGSATRHHQRLPTQEEEVPATFDRRNLQDTEMALLS